MPGPVYPGPDSGLIGGTYGIGGGAIIAPFLAAIFELPIYTIAGAALLATFLTSVAGVGFYSMIAPFYPNIGPVAPDWALGALFGIGGFCGMYFGARLQKFFSGKVIRIGLGVVISGLALRYIIGFFTVEPHQSFLPGRQPLFLSVNGPT
jgi:uncharacterized membrane protein YfcA